MRLILHFDWTPGGMTSVPHSFGTVVAFKMYVVVSIYFLLLSVHTSVHIKLQFSSRLQISVKLLNNPGVPFRFGLNCLSFCGKIAQFKGIVHLKMEICWKCAHPQAIQDVDEFWVFSIGTDLKKCRVTSLAQQWMLCSEWVPSEWESDKNITIIHTTPVHQLTL